MIKTTFQAAGGLLAVALLAGCGQSQETAAPSTAAETPTQEAVASLAADTSPRYSAQTFFETTSFGMPAGTPNAYNADSGDLLIASDETGVFNVYSLNMASGDRTALTTSTGSPAFPVTWFPGDDRFMFRQDGNGDELNHIFVQTPEGEVTDLTPGESVRGGFAGWHDDGKSFFLFTNERDASANDVYLHSVENYSREMVFENTDGLGLSGISGDGRWVVLSKSISSADSDLYLVDLAADEPAAVLFTEHEGNVAHGFEGFTPDNSALMYQTDAHGEFAQVWLYDPATGEHSVMVKDEWDVSYVTHSDSGRYRISGVNRDASTDVTIVDTTTGEAVALPELPAGDLGGLRFSRDESSLALTVNSDVSPSDIYNIDLKAGTAKRLTSALNPAIDSNQLVDGKVVRFASYDGLEIPGILYRPNMASADNPVPALVWVHGGPGGQSRKGYRAAIQHLVNHGYAIYAINNRGSSGYGKTFFHLDDKKHGDADLGDVVASKDFLAEMSWVDGDRIGIIGGSYGGYMVAAALAFEPEAFEVGVNIFGVTNWVRTLQSIPAWWGPARDALFDELGNPETEIERLTAISPLFHTENVVKPLLVVQGANDPRVLQVESDELVANVRANGVPVEYVLFDDEGHGFRKRENRVTASEAYLSFLENHLRGGE